MSDRLFTTEEVFENLQLIPKPTFRKWRKENLVRPGKLGQPGISDMFTFNELLYFSAIKKSVDCGIHRQEAVNMIESVDWADDFDYLVIRSIDGQYVLQDLDEDEISMDPKLLPPNDDEDVVIVINLKKIRKDLETKIQEKLS